MKKSKSKKQSNTQQEATNVEEFSFNITKIAVSQICKSVGFKRSQILALETLTLVATKYLEALAKSSVSFSNAANRTQSNLLDLTNALHDMSQVGFRGASTLYDNNCLLKSSVLEDLSAFVSSTAEIPFAKPIERAKEREMEKVKASTGNLQRGAHIPEWLPSFPDVVSNEKCNKRVNGEELWENSSSVLGCQSDGFEEKRNPGKLAKERARVKFRINGGGKRVQLNGYSGNNLFSQTKDEEPEAEYKKPIKSKENQNRVYKRRKL
ncbi:transcription initiation factor TFIID subunit 8 [Durio zibethinus]|uniref:Transcription initiation factor TFIID subunit 8 n=1 Tax=Durio zibethinus TaxID=66656 RepID=A0A6P5WHP2_DURZI|nr:transcription initiation factor TFIID subunit 8 [Durio zibethinus]